MSFWNFADGHDAVAFLTGSTEVTRSITYAELERMVSVTLGVLGTNERKRLGLILCRTTPEAVTAYLAALRSGDAVILLNENLEQSLLRDILDRYTPEWIMQHVTMPVFPPYRSEHQDNDWLMLRRTPPAECADIDHNLAVLLSTSGTTGSPKMVRLSYVNLSSNAETIASYLGIESECDRAITTLPFNYSYGLSVVNSHLHARATLVLSDHSILTREFWSAFSLHQVSSFAGVPYTYQMFHRLNPRKLNIPTLKTLTQAGGRLSPSLIEHFSQLSLEKGWRFFVMYGQTEATARISFVPPSILPRKIGSIGISIPGGNLSISPQDELIYEGPNVMMGYAESRSDLSNGDELKGVLATGDSGNCRY